MKNQYLTRSFFLENQEIFAKESEDNQKIFLQNPEENEMYFWNQVNPFDPACHLVDDMKNRKEIFRALSSS